MVVHQLVTRKTEKNSIEQRTEFKANCRIWWYINLSQERTEKRTQQNKVKQNCKCADYGGRASDGKKSDGLLMPTIHCLELATVPGI